MGRLRALQSVWVSTIAAVLLLCGAPAVVHAQSGIVGTVKDTSGAVIPGVTVEAASPVLIEGVRSATTNGEGLYRIADLRPGIYTVSFILPGFTTSRRENLELPASFVATVNADMSVGALEESITVAGAAPVVDVQTVTRQNVLSTAVINALPVGRTPTALVTLTPGVTSVNLGAYAGNVQTQSIAYHGGGASDASVSIDGDRINMSLGPGGSLASVRTNMLTIADMTFTTSAGSAEVQDTGLQTNLIPREGGNQLSGSFFGDFTNESFQASNLSDAFRAQGVGESAIVKRWDVAAVAGGPLATNRLWFYGGIRNSELNFTRPGIFEDVDQFDWVYTPDLARPSTAQIEDDNYDLRLTLQASQKDKVSFAITYQPRCQCQWGDQQLHTTEALGYIPYHPNRVLQAGWKRTMSNNLFLDVGVNHYYVRLDAGPQPGYDNTLVAATEVTTGVFFRNNPLTQSTGQWGFHDMTTQNSRASLAYVTGTHSFKFGTTVRFAEYGNARRSLHEYDVHLRNGVPFQIMMSVPWEFWSHVSPDADVWAQDTWTRKRMTLNVGLRYDYFNGTTDAIELPAGRFSAARSFPGSSGTPRWHDISPRAGVAFDLFGNARTAVKASIGRYVSSRGVSGEGPNTYSAVSQSVRTATRPFTLDNGDFIPQCDFTNPQANGECGRVSNLNFGTSNPTPLTRDQDVTAGFGVRPANIEMSASLDHELRPGVGVSVVYYRRAFGNFVVTDNTRLGAGDYDPYCITAPVNPGLPNGGGYQICGLYDVKPEKFGQSQFNVSSADTFGEQKRIYNGVDLTSNGRLSNGITWSGGLNYGRIETERCFVADSPQELRGCHVTPAFRPSFKMFGVFPLLWKTSMSVLYQTIPGQELLASYVARNSEIAPSLGRNLSAGPTATVIIPILLSEETYLDRQHTVDLRFSRTFPLRSGRLKVGLDVNNLLNNANVWSVTTNYGPQWRKPNQMTSGRYVTLNSQYDF